ncbi:MAG: Ig-like domain-containing protein [Oscillospiraceae bacterium]|nr:Ig-like domain-containing protein [Oscillospiraceae bacterium]
MKLKRIAAAVLAAAMLVLTAATVSADSIFDTAKNIDSGKKVSKTLSDNQSLSYKITPTEKGTATVKVTAKTNYFKFYVYDKDGSDVGYDEDIKQGWTTAGDHYWDSKTECYIGTFSFDVKANKTYYVQIQRGSFQRGSGKFEASFKYPSEKVEEAVLMTLNLKKGDTVQLGANGDNASWKSSQKSVATVSGSGLVTAVKKGKTVITLKCGSKKQEIEIVVE